VDPYAGQKYSLRMASALLKDAIQRRDEHALLHPFRPLFAGREEPERVSVVTDMAEPYLPAEGVYGEMVINAGKTVYLWSKGCDAILDISPFTCMNGIVSEAIYPKISRDHDGIPIRIFYFDGTQSHWSATSASSWSWRERTASGRRPAAGRAGVSARPGALRRNPV